MVVAGDSRSLSGYLAELAQVPAKLEQLCGSVTHEAKPIFQQAASHIQNSPELLIFGMASSQWAAWPAAVAFQSRGLNVKCWTAYDGLNLPSARLSKDAVVLMVSQSGRTVEIARLLERLKSIPQRPLIVGVTNEMKSSGLAYADIAIDILAGPEMHAPSKTYVNTVATLLFVYSFLIDPSGSYCARLSDSLLDLASRMRDSAQGWSAWGREISAKWLEHQRPIQFLASGAQSASAWQSSMICSETAKIFSAVGDWATFRHGFEPQVDKSFFAIGFEPPKRDQHVWRTTINSILRRGGQAFTVPQLVRPGRAVSNDVWLDQSAFATVWETLPVHSLCISAAQGKQLDPSQIERKVTLDL